jgi:hypothetical protein
MRLTFNLMQSQKSRVLGAMSSSLFILPNPLTTAYSQSLMTLCPCVMTYISLLVCTQELVLSGHHIQATLLVHLILCLTMIASQWLHPIFLSHPVLDLSSLYLILPQEHTLRQPGSDLLWMFHHSTQIILLHLMIIKSRVYVLL